MMLLYAINNTNGKHDNDNNNNDNNNTKTTQTNILYNTNDSKRY
jgi:hypothetical protein